MYLILYCLYCLVLTGSPVIKKKADLTTEQLLEKNVRTLFVGNLPLSATSRSLYVKFREFGKVLSSRFRSVPVKDKYKKANKKFGVMKKDFVEGADDGRLSQNAYIVFDSKDAVKAAVESALHGTDLFESGHLVRLDFCVRDDDQSKNATGAVKKFDRKKSVYVPHVPPTVTDVDLKAAVEGADPSFSNAVRTIRIVRDGKSGSGAFAFVSFSDRAQATAAIKMETTNHTFPSHKYPTKVRFERILKDEDLAKAKLKQVEGAKRNAQVAAKKSLSRAKWQARLTNKGNPKVVSHLAMPKKERQEKMKGAYLRIKKKIHK